MNNPYNKIYLKPSLINKSLNNKSNISFLNLNIRSLNKNFGKLEILLTKLNFNPDIIGITETWISENKPLAHTLSGYDFIPNKFTGDVGGTAFFVKNNLNYSVLDNLNLNLPNCEDIWIELTLSSKKKLVFGSIYRHPSYNINNFQLKFAKTIEYLNSLNQNFIIGGDFNIDLLDNSSSIQNFKNEIHSQGSWQLVQHPTRIPRKHKKSLLDHVYSNFAITEITTQIIEYDISDHLPNISFIYNHNSYKFPNRKIKIRDTKFFKADNFLSDLRTNISTIPNLPSNNRWDYFEKVFSDTLNKHAPLRSKTRKEIKRKFKPWITCGILKSLKTKQKLYKEFILNNTEQKWNKYKTYRNKLTHIYHVSF